MRDTIFLRRGKSNGYSLLELVLVLAIIVIAAALAWPTMTGALADLYLRQTAYQLVRDIRFVQQQAMDNPSGGWKITFVTRPEVDGYSTEGPHWAVYCYEAGVSRRQNIRQLPEGFSFSGLNFRSQEIRFTELGTPMSAGHVCLRNRAGHTLYVIVAPVTGKPRIDTQLPK